MIDNRHYMDYNATVPLSLEIKKKVIESLDLFGNPSSVHKEGRLVKKALQEARFYISKLSHCPIENLYFTSGASEAASTLLTPYYTHGKNPVFMSHLYVGASEHPSILRGGQFKAENISILPIDKNGLIDQNYLEGCLKAHDLSKGFPLVAIQAANGETGIMQKTLNLKNIIHRYSGIFIVDASQILGKKKIESLEQLGDFFIGSAHKIGGLKGCGFWGGQSGLLAPKPLIKAGGQEKGLRGGTEAVLPILSAGFAAKSVLSFIEEEENRLTKIRDEMEFFLKKNIKNIKIYGENVFRLPNTSFFSIKNVQAETLQIAADLSGFSISAGAACSSGKVEANKTLIAFGEDGREGAIRISLGWATTAQSVENFCSFLLDWLKKKNNNVI